MRELESSQVTTFGWDQTGQIQYNFNKLGYRSSFEYIAPPKYAFFGCSSVFGLGVSEKQRFTSYFVDSYNFGIETNNIKNQPKRFIVYNNLTILNTIIEFSQSTFYNDNVIGIVLWTDRPKEDIDTLINNCPDNFQLLHFKLGSHNSKKCKYLPGNIDMDVSNTHAGPKTHKLWSYSIKQTLKEL